MAKEVARFQLTSGNNNLERWLIDDDANLIFDNIDSTKYVNISSKNYYSSAFFNFPSSIYGYLFSSGFLLCDKATKVYKQRSTDSGTTWSDYSQTNAMVSTYGTLYTMPSHDTNVGGTYVINLICNDAQCISSIAPLFTVVSEYNTYISSIYIPPYTWSPVSSINGKLGNIDLSKILTINDGEPKSGTSSDVKLTTISLVKTLINRIVVDEDEVAVEYQVVDDNFEYIKLVYKQDSEPINVNDGTAIDLDPDESIIGISGICDGNVYYFKIFTNINESEAYEFTTEKPVVPPEYQPYINMINGRRQYDTWNLQMDFFWYDYVGDPNDHGFYWFDGTASEHSFFLRDQRPTVYYFDTKNTSYMCSYQSGNNADTRKICAAPITDIYIISSGNSYTFSTDLSGKIQALWVNDRFGGGYHHYSGTIEMKPYNGNPGTFSFGVDTSDGSSSYTEFTFTGTLEEVFKILSMYCRNVNIYVDNVCWSKVTYQ